MQKHFRHQDLHLSIRKVKSVDIPKGEIRSIGATNVSVKLVLLSIFPLFNITFFRRLYNILGLHNGKYIPTGILFWREYNRLSLWATLLEMMSS